MRQSSTSLPRPPSSLSSRLPLTITTLLFSLALAACGGGEVDDNTAATSPSTAADVHNNANGNGNGNTIGAGPSPGAPPATSSALRPDVLLSNELPQAGSISAIGNGVEGLWETSSGGSTGFAFISPEGRYLGVVAVPSAYPAVFDGRVTLAGTNWRFTSPSAWSISDGLSGYSTALYGTGSVMPRNLFQGSYATGQPDAVPQPLGHQYAAANAMAAMQADVQGAWTATAVFLSIDAQGTLQGRTRGEVYGDCALNGTVTHNEPATRKNLFAVMLTASPLTSALQATAPCRLGPQPFSGYTAVTLPRATGGGRRPALKLLLSSGSRSLMADLEKDASAEVYR